MDLDELRNKWQNINLRVDRLDNDTRRIASELASGRVRTAQTKLANFHYRTALVGLCLPVLAPMIVTVMHFALWVAVIYAAMGIILAILNFLFARKIARSDYMSMPVVSALTQAVDIRKRQKQLQAVGITLGIIVIFSLFTQALDPSSKIILFGMLVGLGVGIPIGLIKYRRAIALARQLQDELKSSLTNDV